MSCPHEDRIFLRDVSPAHVERCERCRDVQGQQETIVEAARALEVPREHAATRDRLLAQAALAAYEDDASVDAKTELPPTRTWSWASLGASAAAGAVAAAAVALAFFSIGTGVKTPPADAVSSQTEPGEPVEPPLIIWQGKELIVDSQQPVRARVGEAILSLDEGRVRARIEHDRLEALFVEFGRAELSIEGKERIVEDGATWSRPPAREEASEKTPRRRHRETPPKAADPALVARSVAPAEPSRWKVVSRVARFGPDDPWSAALDAYRLGRYREAARRYASLRRSASTQVMRDEASRRYALSLFYAASPNAEEEVATWLALHPNAAMRAEVLWAKGILRAAQGQWASARRAHDDAQALRDAAMKSRLSQLLRLIRRAERKSATSNAALRVRTTTARP